MIYIASTCLSYSATHILVIYAMYPLLINITCRCSWFSSLIELLTLSISLSKVPNYSCSVSTCRSCDHGDEVVGLEAQVDDHTKMLELVIVLGEGAGQLVVGCLSEYDDD